MFSSLSRSLTRLVDELAHDVAIIGWSEGAHVRTEYLTVRNAVIKHLVETQAIQVIVAETHFALSRPVDAFIRGLGPDEPTNRVVRGVWSCSRAPLVDNLHLIRWLRQHNAEVPEAQRVRFYGLEMYGAKHDGPAAGLDALTDIDDIRHATTLQRWLEEHQAGGGDHREISVRDAAQSLSLEEVVRRHPTSRIFAFEQIEHLDRRISGSLGDTSPRAGSDPPASSVPCGETANRP